MLGSLHVSPRSNRSLISNDNINSTTSTTVPISHKRNSSWIGRILCCISGKQDNDVIKTQPALTFTVLPQSNDMHDS
jgi:hypothetical protein